MKIKIIKSVFFSFVATFLVLIGITVSSSPPAQAAAFTCEPGFYQAMTGSFKKLDPQTGSYTVIGSTALNLNAVGYNIEDNYIYGINNDPGSATLIKVEDDGSYTDLGAVTGLPSGSVLGDMDHSGNLFVATDNTTLYQIDVSAVSASVINLSGSIAGVNDLVYINEHLYGTNGTNLFDITIADGNVATKPLGLPSATYGAGWATTEDRLYFSQNTNGVIYEISNYTTNSPSATAALQGDGNLLGNDGASCSMAPTVIISLNVVDDEYSTNFNTALNIDAGHGVLQNDEGSSLTVTSNTSPRHGTLTINSDGSFIYTPSDGFAGDDTFTYTASDSVGNTQVGFVTITVAPGAPQSGATHSNLLIVASFSITATILMLLVSRKYILLKIFKR